MPSLFRPSPTLCCVLVLPVAFAVTCHCTVRHHCRAACPPCCPLPSLCHLFFLSCRLSPCCPLPLSTLLPNDVILLPVAVVVPPVTLLPLLCGWASRHQRRAACHPAACRRGRAAHRHRCATRHCRRTACRPAVPHRRCAARCLRCAASLCHPPHLSCRVVVPSVAIVVQPVAQQRDPSLISSIAPSLPGGGVPWFADLFVSRCADKNIKTYDLGEGCESDTE